MKRLNGSCRKLNRDSKARRRVHSQDMSFGGSRLSFLSFLSRTETKRKRTEKTKIKTDK